MADDIFDFGFDKSLNRDLSQEISPLVYDSIEGATQSQSLQFGAIGVGVNNSIFILDPKRGMSLGHTVFDSAPFRVNMQGDLNANTTTLTSVTISGSSTITGTLTVTSLIIAGSSLISSKNGITTHDNSVTGVQTIAHGFGRAPVTVKITAMCASGDTRLNISLCTFTLASSVTATVFSSAVNNSTAIAVSSSSTDAIYVVEADNSSRFCSATIACDATNITLTWSKTGSPTQITQIGWEVIG